MNGKILDQGNRRNCGVYGVMAILQHAGVKFDISTFSELKAPYAPLIEKIFIESGLVRQFVKLPNTKLVDIWLRKGEFILASSARGNFDNPPNVTFDGKTQHFFCICEDLGDRYKCANSWGDQWGDQGYFYINKSDFKYLMTPRRILISKGII